MTYYMYDFSGSYDDTEYDYDEYGQSYSRGGEGTFHGTACVFAESAEIAEEIIIEKVAGEISGNFSIDIDGEVGENLDPEDMEETFEIHFDI
ncbi:MAG: hypothetical protein IJ584_13745 [Bacteroidales bacterium]|nr:hypothetical protein [Bacteroidales bacterium]